MAVRAKISTSIPGRVSIIQKHIPCPVQFPALPLCPWAASLDSAGPPHTSAPRSRWRAAGCVRAPPPPRPASARRHGALLSDSPAAACPHGRARPGEENHKTRCTEMNLAWVSPSTVSSRSWTRLWRASICWRLVVICRCKATDAFRPKRAWEGRVMQVQILQPHITPSIRTRCWLLPVLIPLW